MNCSSPSRQEGRGGVKTCGRSQVAAKMTISREGLAGLERSDLAGPCRVEPRQRGRNSEEATKYCRRSKKCRRWSLLELSVYMQCNFTGRPVSKGGQGEMHPIISRLFLRFIVLLYFLFDCFEWSAELAQI